MLTAPGKNVATLRPTSLPHAAPVTKVGINRPADTLKPYVQIDIT